MPIYESVLKIDQAIGTPAHNVEINVYSSPYGGYLRVSEISTLNEIVTSRSTALMSANECRALAKSLEAMASVLDESELNGDLRTNWTMPS